MISFRSSFKQDKDVSVLFLDQDQIKKPPHFKSILQSLVKAKHFTADAGEVFPVSTDKGLVVFVGLGKLKDLTGTQLKILTRQALLGKIFEKVKSIEVVPALDVDEHILKLMEGILIGTYRWKKYISEKKSDNRVNPKAFTIVAKPRKVYKDTAIICEGVNLTRDLVNDNADVVTSVFLEKTIKDIVKGQKNVFLDILNKKELKAKGLGLHLAVNQGSVQEPKLIIVQYRGTAKKGYETAFVGKGITFDTGGLNLKPSGNIETMKMDMGGAATVIGTLRNIIHLKPKKNILFVCGIAENVTGSKAYKPGDVITGYAGKSVEVANTDAEGRLVLADAISYVTKNYKPRQLIDVATLTGACVVALGYDYTGLVSTHDHLARKLVQASNETDDRAWRLPSYPELKDAVKSEIADIRNLGIDRGAAGALTAAEFLRQFVGKTTWAHLDIAGTAFVNGSKRWYFGHGATGAGVRLMTRFLR